MAEIFITLEHNKTMFEPKDKFIFYETNFLVERKENRKIVRWNFSQLLWKPIQISKVEWEL